MIPHACMRSCLYAYIYDSKSYIFHSPLIIHGSTMVRKCTRLVSIGNTIYTYLFIYNPSYMYIPFSLQYTCVRGSTQHWKHHTIM